MNFVLPPTRRKSTADIRASLRELGLQLSLLNHRVSARLELRDADLECLDVLSRRGPLGPGALARSVGLHPATMTGVLDRLERAGWVERERDPSDRRGVVVRAVRERGAELVAMYSGMNASMTKLCAGYEEAELAVIADFLARTTAAGRTATDELAADQGDSPSPPTRPVGNTADHLGNAVGGLTNGSTALPTRLSGVERGERGERADPTG